MSNYQVSPLTSTDRVNPAGQQRGQQALQRQHLPQIANSSQPVTTAPPGHSTSNGAPPAYEHQQRPPPLELNKHDSNEQHEQQRSGWNSSRGGGGEMPWTARSGDVSAEEEERQTEHEHVRRLVFTMRQAELKRRLQEASRREESEPIEQALAAFHAEYQLSPSNDEDVKLIIRAERQLDFARIKEGIQ